MTAWPKSLFVFLATCLVCVAEEPAAPLPAEKVAALTKDFEKMRLGATLAIEANAKDISAYSRRGDALFFLGKFDEAVADYDQMVKLDDSLDESHWRRGIALFYAGKYKDAAAQFERYHTFDQVDRENGIWRFLSQYKAHGREKAREGLLKYKKEDREPFPSVYKLFAGTMTADEILKGIAAAEIDAAEREKRLFYAHLYIGLNSAVEGDAPAARKHLALATQNTWGPVAGYGPQYMWHVGRLHEELLRTKSAAK
jgi:lipoprotein NlpI